MKQLDIIDDENVKKNMLKKMAPPLVTLLSGESEIQYVALRNISLIVQKYPQILAHEVKVRYIVPSVTYGAHSLVCTVFIGACTLAFTFLVRACTVMSLTLI